MALRFVFLLLAAGVAASPAPAPAQSPELRVMHARVVQLYATGHNAEAAVVARQALELGISEFGEEHPSAAALMVNLAELHGVLDEWPRAEALYRRAAAARSATLAKATPTPEPPMPASAKRSRGRPATTKPRRAIGTLCTPSATKSRATSTSSTS